MRCSVLGHKIRLCVRHLVLAIFALFASGFLAAQDLSPRAYIITPVHGNAITLTYGYYGGNLLLDGIAPITGARASISTPTATLYHALNFFGRSANFTASLPYGVGNFKGTAFGAEQHAYRSGLLDSVYRFSVNLKGGPAMTADEIRKWKQKNNYWSESQASCPHGTVRFHQVD